MTAEGIMTYNKTERQIMNMIRAQLEGRDHNDPGGIALEMLLYIIELGVHRQYNEDNDQRTAQAVQRKQMS